MPLEDERIRALFVKKPPSLQYYHITFKLPDGPCVMRLRQPI